MDLELLRNIMIMTSKIIDEIKTQLKEQNNLETPFVTLSYAQSLDGCISHTKGIATILSNNESMKLTHQIRNIHDSIMCGVGTVLADNPSLTVRLVEGKSPMPIIIDSDAKSPPTSKVFQRPSILAITDQYSNGKLERIKRFKELKHITILECKANNNNQIDLHDCLIKLRKFVSSIMIEGGAKLITSLIKEKHLVNHVVVTIAPIWLGGYNSVQEVLKLPSPRLIPKQATLLGDDIILQGCFQNEM